MATESWTDAENELVVADYFVMLKADLVGHPYNKAEHRRKLRGKIKRDHTSIEYKRRNISAVLQGLGETWIPGYQPAFNFQMSLADAVVHWLHSNPEFETLAPIQNRMTGSERAIAFVIEPPPAPANQPRPDLLDKMLAIARRFDVADRAERNRDLGRAGEKLVFDYEQTRLAEVGRTDLAKCVRWVSQEDGDGAGYDIQSFSADGQTRLIEVKTTKGWKRTPFYISRNELAAAKDRPSEWCLLRLWNFAREPRAFELHPPLDAYVKLIATNYEAIFH